MSPFCTMSSFTNPAKFALDLRSVYPKSKIPAYVMQFKSPLRNNYAVADKNDGELLENLVVGFRENILNKHDLKLYF